MKYTILPWMDGVCAGYIIFGAMALLICYSIFEFFFKRHNLSMRRGTLAIIGNTVWPFCLNICIYALIYWYWAIPASLALSLIFWVIIRGELKTAHEEELEGCWGLFPAIRKIRGEAFADLSIEEQLAYKAHVKPQKFYWWIYVPALVILPFCIILLLERLGIGDYLFFVVQLAE